MRVVVRYAQTMGESPLRCSGPKQHSACSDSLRLIAASSPAARTAITYFNNNLTRMDYARYQKLNLQIGSGTIESACKHLVDARFKHAGMRWLI